MDGNAPVAGGFAIHEGKIAGLFGRIFAHFATK